MTDLDKLIEAVEAGDEPALYAALRAIASAARDKGDYWPAHDATKAFDGSLDAALRLHEALLPGWNVQRLFGPYVNDPQWRMTVKEMALHGPEVSALGPTPAHAWLLAILRALATRPTTPGTGDGE